MRDRSAFSTDLGWAVACGLDWKGVGLPTFVCALSDQGVLRELDFASGLGRVGCSLLVEMGKGG